MINCVTPHVTCCVIFCNTVHRATQFIMGLQKFSSGYAKYQVKNSAGDTVLHLYRRSGAAGMVCHLYSFPAHIWTDSMNEIINISAENCFIIMNSKVSRRRQRYLFTKKNFKQRYIRGIRREWQFDPYILYTYLYIGKG